MNKLEVDGKFLKINGKKTFLAGVNHRYNLEIIKGKANYKRTWLDSSRRDFPVLPFVQVNGKSDLTRLSDAFCEWLFNYLNKSAEAGIVQELTLFNPWSQGYDRQDYLWSSNNCIELFFEDEIWRPDSTVWEYKKKFIDRIMLIVNSSQAKDFVIFEADNEAETGQGAHRKAVVEYIKKVSPKAIVSTIEDYCNDYDVFAGQNDIISRHKGGTGNPDWYKLELSFNYKKPVIWNELYIWRDHDRETQMKCFQSILDNGGAGFCVDWWEEGGVPLDKTIEDVSNFYSKEENEMRECLRRMLWGFLFSELSLPPPVSPHALESCKEIINDYNIMAKFHFDVVFSRYVRNRGWLLCSPGQNLQLSLPEKESFLAYIFDWKIGEKSPVKIVVPNGKYFISWRSTVKDQDIIFWERESDGDVMEIPKPTGIDFDVLLIVNKI